MAAVTARSIMESLKTALGAISGINKVIISRAPTKEYMAQARVPMIIIAQGDSTPDKENDGYKRTTFYVQVVVEGWQDNTGEKATKELDTLTTLVEAKIVDTFAQAIQIWYTSDTGFQPLLPDKTKELWFRTITLQSDHQEF